MDSKLAEKEREIEKEREKEKRNRSLVVTRSTTNELDF